MVVGAFWSVVVVRSFDLKLRVRLRLEGGIAVDGYEGIIGVILAYCDG